MQRKNERHEANLADTLLYKHNNLGELKTPPPGGGATPYNGPYGEDPPERGTLFKLEVCKKRRDFTS